MIEKNLNKVKIDNLSSLLKKKKLKKLLFLNKILLIFSSLRFFKISYYPYGKFLKLYHNILKYYMYTKYIIHFKGIILYLKKIMKNRVIRRKYKYFNKVL